MQKREKCTKPQTHTSLEFSIDFYRHVEVIALQIYMAAFINL